MCNSCMDAAPFVAQEILRAGIAGNDQELAELSYQVLNSIIPRSGPDGSQAHDTKRDC